MRHPLTDARIRNLHLPKHGQFEVWDTRIPGFGVRVSHGGAKAFVLVYRFNGRSRRMTLGRYGTISLLDARKLAHGALRAVALGSDPGAEKLRLRRIPAVEKFDGFVTHFMESYARPKNRTAAETERLLRREFVKEWRSRPIIGIARHDVLAVLDRTMSEGNYTTANRSLAAVRRLFNWAVERGMLERSPCAGIAMPAKAVARDRILSDAELQAVWNGLQQLGYPYGRFAQLLILTAQRKGEVAGMRWEEVDLKQALWSIPAKRNKSGRAHVIPITARTVEILGNLPRLSDELVFPGRDRARTIHDFSRWKRQLDELSKVSNWRIHDLRRTAATGMARLGVSPHVVERVLNHTTGTLGGIAGVYNRFGYLPEMRAALESWERHVVGLITARAEDARAAETSSNSESQEYRTAEA